MKPNKKPSRARQRGDHTRLLAEDGFILTDSAWRPVALDQGAVAISAALTGERSRAASAAAEVETASPPVLDVLGISGNGLPAKQRRFRAGLRDYTADVFEIQWRAPGLRDLSNAVCFRRDYSMSDPVAVLMAEYHLTEREMEAVQGIAMGLTSKEIAYRMKISAATVKAFLRLIMAKMGAPNRACVVSRLLAAFDRAAEAANREASGPTDVE